MKDPRLSIAETSKPHTFLINFDWLLHYKIKPNVAHNKSCVLYRHLAEQFVEEVRKQGMKGRLKQRYTYSSVYYITFRSKHDAMAFKLTWL